MYVLYVLMRLYLANRPLEGAMAVTRPISSARQRAQSKLKGPSNTFSTNATKQLSRPQTVKRIWAYVRSHDLQDPSDKRMIRCDEPLKAVFKQEKVHMFTMNKILSQNMYNMDE